MKRIVEVEGEGFEAFLGENITLYCGIYIYNGKLTGVNENFLKLENAKIVYDTGAHDSKVWADASDMPHAWYVMIQSIESFGEFK